MKEEFSLYLSECESGLKELVCKLNENFPFVSILGTDVIGTTLRVGQRNKSITDYNFSERGFVVRVYKDGLYSEYSLNEFDNKRVEEIAKKICHEINEQFEIIKATNSKIYETEMIMEEETELFSTRETNVLPSQIDLKQTMERMTQISKKGLQVSDKLLECVVSFSFNQVNKIYLSTKKNLKQTYVFSEGVVVALARNESKTAQEYTTFSSLGTTELLDRLENEVTKTANNALELLDAKRVVPGEYDIIVSPEISGLIAHEAFGHGLEMDMFVKERALAKQYVDKQVANEIIEMHEGAKAAQEVSSYAFDDEGTLGTDTVEISNGILVSGICDALSALRLGVTPTGNGKRESFERKAYTRMTNTIFTAGNDKLEDMISSIKSGYLLEGMESGMEDPKHWGIQLMLSKGREIKDGKLTGKIISPVIMTGYVPDLLKSITMKSQNVETFGSGACGKGYKEWVKVSDGGPYMKAKGILG